MKNVLNKSVYLVNFWLLLTVVVFNSCGIKNNDKGVVINGVKWATRNVDSPGTFAAKPEDPGMFYQWNRRVGWSATDPLKNSNGGIAWDSSTPADDTWEKSNDPSPAGWRVPSLDEIKKLLDDTKVDNEWTEYGGVAGRKFTDKTTGNSLFLPAAGYRLVSDGTLIIAGSNGSYWSGTAHEVYETFAYYLDFYFVTASRYSRSRSWGFSVRSVAE